MNNLSSNNNYIPTQTMQQWEEQRNADHLSLTLHSLNESASLYCSVIDDEALALANSSNLSQSHETVLVAQFNSLAEAASVLKKTLEILKREGTGVASTGITIGTGIINLFSGNLLVGIPVTAVGLNELKKIIERAKEAPNASNLISEARAGISMIKQLEEFQIQNLKSVESQIADATEQLKEAQEQLDIIEDLSVKGSSDGELKKQEALKLTREAVINQQQAIYTLQSGKAKTESALANLKKVSLQVEDLIKFAREKTANPEDIDKFIDEIKNVLNQINHAQADLAVASKNTNDGLKLLHESVKSYGVALQKYSEAVAVMKARLYEIQMKAHMTDEVEKANQSLDRAQNGIHVVQNRAEIQKELAEYAEKKCIKHEQEAINQFGQTSMLLGATLGTAAAPLVSPFLILPVAALGTASAHYVRRAARLANQYFPKHAESVPQLDSNSSATLGTLKVKYNDASTGWGGYLRDTALWATKKAAVGSKTEGVIAINLGGQDPFIYSFNRNSNSELGVMKEEDIRKIEQDLRQLLKTGKIFPRQVLQILDSLANVPSEHGVLALIKPNCLFLRDLRDLCRRSLNG